MMKKLLLIMIMAALIMPMVLAVDNSSATNTSTANTSVINASAANASVTADPQVEIRTAHIEAMTFVKQIEMAAVISYVDEIKGNSSKLASLLEEFKNQSAKILDMSNASDINNAIKILKSAISSFKTEARKQIDENSGKLIDAAARIQNASSKDADNIKELEDVYYDLKEKNILAILDKRVESAQKSLDKLNESGLNTEEMQAKLDSISALRSDLKKALEKRNASLEASLNAEILNISKELQSVTASTQADAAEKAKLEYWLNAGSRISKIAKTAISELKSEEINATSLEDANDAIKTNLKDAEKALEKSNASDAKTALKELKTNLEKAVASYKEISSMKKGVSKTMKGKLESLTAALDKFIKALGSEL